MASARRVSAADFQNNFGRYADAARTSPVVVTRYGRDELVVLSASEYARLRSGYRKVISLADLTEAEAIELAEAISEAQAAPAAAALDHLMDEDDARPA